MVKIYNLRIVPNDLIFEEIDQFKQKFETLFGKQPLVRSKPHITLAAFEMDTRQENIMIRAFNQLSSIAKFRLEIQGFDIFENNANVLLLKVATNKEVKHIHTLIKILWIRDLHRKLTTIKIPATPHITISKTSGTKMLHDSLSYFSKIEYIRQLEVNQLTLVSRRQHETWDWEYHIPLGE